MSFTRVDDGVVLHHVLRPGRGRAVVLLNSLGTDFRIWDAVLDALPREVPVLRLDKRGHGLSQVGLTTIERLARDVDALMNHHDLGAALVCGVSIGGLVAQSLALAHPTRVSGLVLSNTGARIGDTSGWQTRLDVLERDGLESMADAVLERWFSPAFRATAPEAIERYRAMLTRTPVAGYAAACRAIRDADLRERVGEIRVPTLCLAGTEDVATPPELVRDLANRIEGAGYVEIDGAGHLPCIEAPDAVASQVARLLGEVA